MLGQWRKPMKPLNLLKLLVTGSLLTGLYLPAHANTTTPVATPAAAEQQAAPASGVEVSAVDLSSTRKTVSIALLLPLRSDILREPATVLQAGFMAAHERERDGVVINVVETGDTPQDILTGYKAAVTLNDIVVGPLSRTGVTAVAQSGAVDRTTIALTPPEITDNTPVRLPSQMLVMGLSIEDEARQVADWADQATKPGRALILLTKAAWQRRAAAAFEAQWTHRGLAAESIEIAANDGFLNGRTLLQLKKQIETEVPTAIFLALDARQARQVRAIIGKEVPLFGTSQLNPFALTDRDDGERIDDMDGARLLDIPWQLQADHPAVMVYPRLVVNADQRRSPDLERLYALGIDAYRVAREIASGRTQFEIDGVTGKLTVRFAKEHAHFERTEQPAVYRGGVVVAADAVR